MAITLILYVYIGRCTTQSLTEVPTIPASLDAVLDMASVVATSVVVYISFESYNRDCLPCM